MGIKDRSPRMGSQVPRNPGTHRTASNSTPKKESFIKKTWVRAALSLTALFLCGTVTVTAVVMSADNSTVRAADINIGSDGADISASEGVGRYSEKGDASVTTDGDADSADPSALESETDLSADALQSSSPAAENEVANSRYTVTFEFFGKDSVSCSAEEPATVGELASRLGITFEESDSPSIPLDTVISSDTTVTTDNVVYVVTTVSTPIAYETVYKDDYSVPTGTYTVETEGVNGTSVTEYEVKYVNGVEVSSTELGTTVTDPVTKVIIRGCAPIETTPADPGYDTRPGGSVDTSDDNPTGGTFVGGDGKTYSYSTYIDVMATIYYTGGTCASGHVADETVIAVDPTVIPLGTEVYITGEYADIGYRTAEDTGGSIKGYKIDICIDPSDPRAYNFGWRPMRVYILN